MPIEGSHHAGNYEGQKDKAPRLEREKVREFLKRKLRQIVPLPHGVPDVLEYFFGLVRRPTGSHRYASLGASNLRDFVLALD